MPPPAWTLDRGVFIEGKDPRSLARSNSDTFPLLPDSVFPIPRFRLKPVSQGIQIPQIHGSPSMIICVPDHMPSADPPEEGVNGTRFPLSEAPMRIPTLLLTLAFPVLALSADKPAKSTQAAKPAPSTPAPSASPAASQSQPAKPAVRAVKFNGKPLDEMGLAILQQLEAAYGTRLPDGSYWYDSRCGAFGAWGGPTVFILPAGLNLGGPVPANASGTGTGIFVNGRELHAFDVLYLQHLVGAIQPGRYFTDAMGNAGLEGGPVLVNLLMAAQQKGGFSHYKSNAYSGERHSISSEGVSFTNSTGKTVSWYPGLGSSVSN
jgi:hypothetical protein